MEPLNLEGGYCDDTYGGLNENGPQAHVFDYLTPVGGTVQKD